MRLIHTILVALHLVISASPTLGQNVAIYVDVHPQPRSLNDQRFENYGAAIFDVLEPSEVLSVILAEQSGPRRLFALTKTESDIGAARFRHLWRHEVRPNLGKRSNLAAALTAESRSADQSRRVVALMSEPPDESGIREIWRAAQTIVEERRSPLHLVGPRTEDDLDLILQAAGANLLRFSDLRDPPAVAKWWPEPTSPETGGDQRTAQLQQHLSAQEAELERLREQREWERRERVQREEEQTRLLRELAEAREANERIEERQRTLERRTTESERAIAEELERLQGDAVAKIDRLTQQLGETEGQIDSLLRRDAEAQDRETEALSEAEALRERVRSLQDENTSVEVERAATADRLRETEAALLRTEVALRNAQSEARPEPLAPVQAPSAASSSIQERPVAPTSKSRASAASIWVQIAAAGLGLILVGTLCGVPIARRLSRGYSVLVDVERDGLSGESIFDVPRRHFVSLESDGLKVRPQEEMVASARLIPQKGAVLACDSRTDTAIALNGEVVDDVAVRLQIGDRVEFRRHNDIVAVTLKSVEPARAA